MKKFFQGLKLKRGESILSDRERVSEGSEDEEDYGEQEEYEQSNVFSNDDEIYECSSDEFTSDYEASPACESEQDTYLNRDEIAFISEQVTRNLHEPQKHNPCDSDGAAVFSVESYELLDEQPTNQCQRVECTENSDDEVLQLRCEAGVSSQMPPPLPAELPKKTSKFRSLPRTPSSSSNSSKILSRPLPRIPKLSENGQDLYESGDKTDKEPEIPKTKPALPTREDILDTNTKKNILSKTPKPARPITPVKLAKKAVTSTAPSHIKPKPKLLHGNNITKPTENEVKAISPALPSKAKKKLTIKIKPENEKRSHLEAQKSFTENDKKTTEVPRSAEETDPTNKNKKIFHKNLANRINKIEPSAKKLNNEIANSIFVKLDQQKREASEGKPLKLPVHSPKTSHHSNSEKPSVPTKKPLKDINLSSKIKNPPKPPAHSGDGLIQKQNVSGCLSRSVSTSEQNNNETRLERAVSKVAEKSKKMLSKNENGKSSEKSLPLNKEHKSEEVDETTQNYLDAPWFFGEITREEACNKLINYGKQGAFLIRKRQENSAEIPFSLSIYNGVRVMNLQIRVKEEGKLAIGFEKPDEKTFADLQDIVFFYSTNLLEIKGKRHENILLSCSPQK